MHVELSDVLKGGGLKIRPKSGDCYRLACSTSVTLFQVKVLGLIQQKYHVLPTGPCKGIKLISNVVRHTIVTFCKELCAIGVSSACLDSGRYTVGMD